MNDYIIEKELGKGMFGTVFLVSRKGKKYAMKIEHIFTTNKEQNLKSKTWREIDFANNFAKKYPDFFMQLVDYSFIDNCKHIQKHDYKIKNNLLDTLQKSPICSMKIYSLVVSSLEKKWQELNLLQYYSIILQATQAIYLMNKAGYVHTDLHPGNIGLIQTNKKFINVFGKEIPTFGYQVQIIDYGNVLHKKYILDDSEKRLYKIALKEELIWIMNNLAFNMMALTNNLQNINIKEQIKKFKKNEYYKFLRPLSSNENDAFFLYLLMYPRQSQIELFGKKKYFPVYYYLPIMDILYIIKNKNNLNKKVNYFIDQINYK